MYRRLSYRADSREEVMLGGMRRRSIDPHGGDPKPSDLSIPDDTDLGVIVCIVFICDLIRIESLINVINS